MRPHISTCRPICSVNTISDKVTPPDSTPTEHKFLIKLPKNSCPIPRGTWIWLEVQAVMDFGTHGQWGWSLNQGAPVKYDALTGRTPTAYWSQSACGIDDNGIDLEGGVRYRKWHT